jgi:hypothetical protein
MATLTLSARAPEAIGRGPWTSHDWYESFLFLVQSCGIVCVGVFLYSLGPALGIAVLVGSLVAWSKVAGYLAARKAPCLADEDAEHDRLASSVSVPSRYAGTARLKNDLLSVSAAIASRLHLRQST